MDKAEAISKYASVELPKRFRERISPDQLQFLKIALHPTRRADSVEATKRLLRYLNAKDLVTSLEVQEELGMAEITVLKRLKTLRDFSLLQRKLNRYYVVTPRLHELVRLYIEHL